MQNVGQLQLSWGMVRCELQQLAIELFGLWPGLRCGLGGGRALASPLIGGLASVRLLSCSLAMHCSPLQRSSKRPQQEQQQRQAAAATVFGGGVGEAF